MIRGRRIQLRPVEEDDVPLVLRWQNSPEVWWDMDYERPSSVEDVREELATARQEGHPFLITVDGRPIGRVGLNGFRRRDRICSLYLYVGEPAFRGQEHELDAVMTLLGYAFSRVDLHQVELRTLATNDRVLAVSGRSGFVREATLRQRSFRDGGWVDHVVMSVNRDEFASAVARWDGEAV